MKDKEENTGRLTLVPTPIGNLEDITLRAIRVLKEADLVMAEDTRTSGQLLKHLEIDKKMLAFHSHNEHHVLQNIMEKLRSGQRLALISDAGTPGISDPGFLVVREAIKSNIPVECLPGPVALIPALVVSGFPTDRFCFEGFLPHKKGRQTRWKEMASEPRTLVLYESPHRLLKLIEEIIIFCGPEREVSVSREISKKFEETMRGTASEVAQHFKKNAPKGEFVVVIKGSED